MSITFNIFSLVLSFLSIEFQNKERFIETQMEELGASYEFESVISTHQQHQIMKRNMKVPKNDINIRWLAVVLLDD